MPYSSCGEKINALTSVIVTSNGEVMWKKPEKFDRS